MSTNVTGTTRDGEVREFLEELAQQYEETRQDLIDSQKQTTKVKAISHAALSQERSSRPLANRGFQSYRSRNAAQPGEEKAFGRIKAKKEPLVLDDDVLLTHLSVSLMTEIETGNMRQQEETKESDISVSARAAVPARENPIGQQGPVVQEQTAVEVTNGPL